MNLCVYSEIIPASKKVLASTRFVVCVLFACGLKKKLCRKNNRLKKLKSQIIG
jgi:hypothetical protein